MNSEPESPNTRSNAKGRSTKHHKLVSRYKPQRGEGEGGKLKTGKKGWHEDQRPLTGARAAREGGGKTDEQAQHRRRGGRHRAEEKRAKEANDAEAKAERQEGKRTGEGAARRGGGKGRRE